MYQKNLTFEINIPIVLPLLNLSIRVSFMFLYFFLSVGEYNLGGCGSCWAFSTTGVSSDFLCIGDYTTQYMAPEHSIQCDTGNNQCNGGYISRAFQFHVNSGLVPQSCKSYRGTSARRCSDECDDSTLIEPSIVYNMLSYKRIHGSTQEATIESIKEAIYNSGSVAASFKVYEDFQEYYGLFNKKDVYKDPGEGYRGQFYTYHAIKIIGYDFEASPPYWIIQNSWGTSWADGGYFRLDASTNSGNTEGLEGVLDILGDVYQPYVEPYKDACSPFYDCNECTEHGPKSSAAQSARNTSTTDHSTFKEIPQKRFSLPKKFSSLFGHSKRSSVWRPYRSQGTPRPIANNTDAEPQCGYCLSSDMCVSVDSTNRPLRGMCTDMAVSDTASTKSTASDITFHQCPLDDCAAYSEDPLKCLRHKGCHFCSQTNKCKKGSFGQQNSGTCLAPITSYAQLVQNYSCLLLDETSCTKDSTCGWCAKNSVCLPIKTVYKDECQPSIGHCYDENNEEKCVRGSSATTTQTETAQTRSNAQSNANDDDTEFCLHQPCNLCGATNNSRCQWCYTTESCIPVSDDTCTINSKDVEEKIKDLPTFGDSSFPTQTLTRCSPCLNYSSCQDCAADPQCGWYSDMSLCMPGIIDSKLSSVLPDKYQGDVFIAHKLRCPVIYLDDADDDDASGQAKSKTEESTATQTFV